MSSKSKSKPEPRVGAIGIPANIDGLIKAREKSIRQLEVLEKVEAEKTKKAERVSQIRAGKIHVLIKNAKKEIKEIKDSQGKSKSNVLKTIKKFLGIKGGKNKTRRRTRRRV